MTSPSETKGSGAARRRTSRLFTYHVNYLVARIETYEIEATNAEEAKKKAFLSGTYLDESDAIHFEPRMAQWIPGEKGGAA